MGDQNKLFKAVEDFVTNVGSSGEVDTLLATVLTVKPASTNGESDSRSAFNTWPNVKLNGFAGAWPRPQMLNFAPRSTARSARFVARAQYVTEQPKFLSQ